MLTLLDYGKLNPFGEIFGKPKNLAWPVNAWRVTLPKPDNSGGPNMFERVILKIIDASGIREADALAEEVCIPVELVKFILLRLKDKALIDKNNEIISQGRGRWMIEKEPVYVTAILFQELATGKILPFLHWLDDKNPLKKKEAEKKYFKIKDYDIHIKKNPNPNDVILALRAMKKRFITSGNYSRKPPIGQIIIADKPERYYLDCPIAIQKSDGEFRIADPFGNDFSLHLESSFSQLLEQDENLNDWLMEWKKNLSNPEQDKPAKTAKEPFENDRTRGRYPKLVSNLHIRQEKQYRNIRQIYSALEWALFYTCVQRQYDAVVNKLKFTDQTEHSNLLNEAAKRIGLDLPPNGFKPVPQGKFVDFLQGKAEMATLISITLLMAEKDKAHPLHKIADKYSDFIIRLLKIKNKRDKQAHGKRKIPKDEELPEDFFMREIVTALLPDIRFTYAPAPAADKEAIADIMLDSRTNIQSEFGFKYFNRLGTKLQDRLIYAERFWLSCKDEDDVCAFVYDLYTALQVMFRKKLEGVLPPDIDDSEFIVQSQSNAKKAGLGELSVALRTVKPLMVSQTLQGYDRQTLGACVVAFLLVSDNDSLEKVCEIQPSFLSDVANIISLRDHGNEPVPMKKDEIKTLRKSAYSTIKTLLEV
jgi:hypothetical protein